MAEVKKRVKVSPGFRVVFDCDNCGKEVDRPEGAFKLKENHFCSKSCSTIKAKADKVKPNKIRIDEETQKMILRGYTDEDIARRMGVLPSTISKKRKMFEALRGDTKGHLRINPFKIKYYDGEDEEQSIIEAVNAPEKEYNPDDLDGWEKITYERLIKNEERN